MQIAIDARPLTNPIDGIARYTSKVLSHLLKHQEHTWHLYTHKPLPSEMTVNARVRYPPRLGQNSLLASQVLFPRWAKHDKIDVYWSPRHHLPVTLGIPSVVTVHDLCWKHAPQSMPRARRTIERLLMPRSIYKATRLTTLSNAVKQQLIDYSPLLKHKIAVVPPGPSFTQSTLAESSRSLQPTLICVGTIEPRKRHSLLIDAFGRVADKVPHDLILIGRPGWGDLQLDELIRARNLGNRVFWVRDATDAQLADYYQKADWLITASSYEGFNLPILEALSSGTPVLASDLDVHREVAGEAGVFFDIDVDSLADVLVTTLNSADARAEAAGRASTVATQFAWQNTADKLLETFFATAH